jgi:hypothetical protein
MWDDLQAARDPELMQIDISRITRSYLSYDNALIDRDKLELGTLE